MENNNLGKLSVGEDQDKKKICLFEYLYHQ